MNSAGIKNHIFRPFHLSFTIFYQNSGYLYITNPELHPKAFYMVFLSLPETDVGLAGDPQYLVIVSIQNAAYSRPGTEAKQRF